MNKDRTAFRTHATQSHARRLVAIVIAGAVAVTGCSVEPGASGAADDEDGSESTLIIGMSTTDIPLLDAGLADDQGYEGLRFVANQLYDGLTRFDLTSGDEIPTVVASLAESWEPNEDLTEWTFTLRPDVTFHDGEPWDADAAIFNLERHVDTGADHFYQDLADKAALSIAGIESFEKIDDMTVQINTIAPWSYLPTDLTTIYFASPKAVQDLGTEGFAEAPVGTGPFVFESVQRGQQLSMRANDSYWDGRPNVDRVVLRPIPDPTARVAALRAGEVDWIETPPPDDVESLNDLGFQVLTNSYDHVWPWVYDTTKPPFDDPRVREALNWAIDRDALVENILQGTAEPALGYVPKANAAYRADGEVYGYDPDRAMELLDDAGYADGLTFRLSYPTGGSGNMLPGPMNTALQSDLARVGVTVELEPIEWASLLADFFETTINDGAEAMNISLSFQSAGFWNLWFGTGSGVNVGGYSNPDYDELIARASTIADEDERADVYAEAAGILAADHPWLVVVNDRAPRVLAPNVTGFTQPQSWFIDLTSVSVE